jgi:hypothetical protein
VFVVEAVSTNYGIYCRNNTSIQYVLAVKVGLNNGLCYSCSSHLDAHDSTWINNDNSVSKSMATDIKDITKNIQSLNMTESSIETLINFERVMAELGMYAYANWQSGELISGPYYEKYFITCEFMWPQKLMPDPDGAERLLHYDCEVTYRKDLLSYPKKIRNNDDFKPGTKVAARLETPIWVVSITIPKVLINEIRRGSLELEDDIINIEDLDTAYEQGDDEVAQPSNPQSDTEEQPNA